MKISLKKQEIFCTEKKIFLKATELKKNILEMKRGDFVKYKKRSPVLRLREVLDSVIQQAGGKYIYAKAGELTNIAQAKEAIELLEMAGAEIDRRTNTPVAGEVNRTSIPGVFACGNACKVYDLVDSVTRDSMLAGRMAAQYLGAK